MSEMLPLRTLRPDMPFGGAVREILLAHIATISTWATFLTQPEHAHEHHQMRIAVKRLRYTLDICRDLLPEALYARCIHDLKALQEELGKLHDQDVLFLSIEEALAQEKPIRAGKQHEAARARAAERRASLEALASTTAETRRAIHQRCLAIWQEFNRRDGFAALQEAIDVLAAVPDTTSHAPLNGHERGGHGAVFFPDGRSK